MKNGEVDFLESNAYVSANDLVDGLCIREDDFDKKRKPKYLFYFKEVYTELNLSIIRQTNRVLIKVNHKLKCIDAPDDYLFLSSIDAPNKHGKFEPLIINKNLPTDTVDLGASKTCGCDCGCDCEYCANIKNYEIIYSTVTATMPDTSIQEFTASERKKIMKDGSFVREVTTPVEVFQDNVHTSTVLQTTTEFLCRLDIKECGCIKKSPENEVLLIKFSDSYTIANDCGCPPAIIVKSEDNSYNISDKGNRIQLPFDFRHDYVRLRYYADKKTKDLRAPYIAQKAIRYGIKAEQTTFDAPGSKENLFWMGLYNAEKETLAGNIARLQLSDFYKHILGVFNVL